MRLQQLLFKSLGLTMLLSLWPTWAAKILFVFPYDMNSQCKLLTPYMEALMRRGHHLTLIHAFKECSIVERIDSIYVNDRHNSASFDDEIVTMTSKWGEVKSIRNYMVKTCLNVLENRKVQQLLKSNVSFDLIVLEPSHTDAIYGLAQHFNATLMGLATCGGDWNLDTLVGYTASSTFEPMLPIGFRRGNTLLDRFSNLMLISEEWLLHKLIFLPRLRAVHEHFFGHLTQSFEELRQSFALILLNQHFSLFEARPNVPSLVEVAGMHVPKQLPPLASKLAQFIDEAPHGVIYMALGTELQSKDLPAATLALILDTFEALPQRVIWKFEGNSRPNVSSSIYMNSWLPQQSILAHPNVRLFISHGGILSIIEAAHYAKPVLGMPLFFDQFHNIERLQAAGMAQLLDIQSLTRQDFESTVIKLLEQPQYRRDAQALSQRFRDQPLHPLDSAVYWTEYVLRYKGAPYMRLAVSSMKLMDYYCLDNLLMIIGRLSLLVLLMFYVLRKLMRCLEWAASSYWLLEYDMFGSTN